MNSRKMTMFATHAPGEVIDAIRPDLEAFTSLWTALRVNYEGTNITRTVARLLHMYQPEEGVIAYERLLRTLFVLLEDFDNDGLQLLVSMVPPPKNVTDEIVKEVFNRATGFARVDAPIFHKNTDMTITAPSTPELSRSKPKTQSCLSTTAQKKSDAEFSLENKTVPESNNSVPTSQTDITNGLQNRMQESPQIISQESSEVFRGFPPSEIFNTQSHVQSITNFYRPSTSYSFAQARGGQSFINFGQIVGQNSGQIQQQISASSGLIASAGYIRPKWFQNPYLIQKNSYTPVSAAQYQDFYLKTVNNQYVKVPAAKVNNFHQASVNTPQGSYQTLYNNPHDYLRNRSNTVTSGLLEKIQRHRSLQEAAITKILTECGSSRDSTTLSADVTPNSQESVELKIIDLKLNSGKREAKMMSENLSLKKCNTSADLKNGENLMIKTYGSNTKASASGNEKMIFMRNGEDKIVPGPELESGGKNHSLNSETFEQFTKEVRMRQRAIQEDIYKMDVVRHEILDDDDPGNEEEADNPKEPEILTSSEELRNSCKKFIDRSKTEEIIEVPIFPKTRALHDIPEHSEVLKPSESNLWRLLTSKNISGGKTGKIVQSDEQSHQELEEFSAVDQEISVSPVEISADTNKELSGPSNSGLKRIVRRKKPEVSSSTRGKSQRLVQKGPMITHAANFHDDLDLIDRGTSAGPAERDVQKMQINLQTDTASRCPSSIAQQTNSTSIGPATTMAELAAYKKQYYDALLSIQKAKAAVANSLAISSMGSSPGFDPYYYNYLQHQHRQILQRRQHQIFMGQRFSQQQSLPQAPGGTPWFRNAANWRYPVITPSRLPQRPQMLRPSPTSSIWPPGVGYLGRESQNNVIVPQRQQLNVVQTSKPPIKRRKLEEIVGKLKETESNGSNN